MDTVLNQIMQMQGAEEYQTLISKWDTLSRNIRTIPLEKPIILPDLLLVANSGTGITNLLKFTSDFLYYRQNLMSFYGDVKYLEFTLGYCGPETPFTELQRMLDEVQNAAGFRNEYRGVIGIDINEWRNHYQEKHFAEFMECLAANHNSWVIFLCIAPGEEQGIRNLTAFLNMYLRLETIHLWMPELPGLMEFVETSLGRYGLRLDASAIHLLEGSVEKLSKSRYFDGYKSLQQLSEEIIYTFFSRPKIESYCLTAEDLKDFGPNSTYIQRTEASYQKKRTIGFTAGGRENDV